METAGSHSKTNNARKDGDADLCGLIVGAAGSTLLRQAGSTASIVATMSNTPSSNPVAGENTFDCSLVSESTANLIA